MSIIVYYNPEFREATSDIQGFVNQVIAETNQGYANSLIPLVVELFCTKEASVSDSGVDNAKEQGNILTNLDILSRN